MCRILCGLLIGMFGLLCSASTVRAQMGWGVMGGIQLTNIRSNLPGSRQLGFQGGIFAEIDAVVLGGRVESLVSSKGAEVEVDWQDPVNGQVMIKSNVDLLYLEIPLLFNVSPEATFELYVGPLISIKLDDKIESSIVQGQLSVPVEDIERQLNFNGIDFGLALGIGFNVGRVDLGGRYNLGIDTAGEYQVGNLVGEFSNRAFALYAGYDFSP